MASVDVGDAVFVHESVVRGHNIYKETWTPRVGEILLVRQEPGNEHDRKAVCLLKGEMIVGHVPREFSRFFWFFLSHGGRISCEVTGRRKHGKGLEVPCAFRFFGPERMVPKMKDILLARSKTTPCSQ